VAAVYISSVLKLPPTDKVYLIGMSGVETELAGQGISWIGGTSTEDTQLGPFDLHNFERDASVKVVLCGGDKFITYKKLSKAFQYLIGEKPCEFLSVSMDRVVPGQGGTHLAAGALTYTLSCALGREPLLLGKPGRAMWDCIVAK
jgi:4-nitrophenyl phosphatase